MTFRHSRLRSVGLAAVLVVVLQVAVPAAAHAGTGTGSHLTLDATPSTAKVGDEITLAGVLSFDDLSSAAGLTIELTRDDGSGSQSLPDVMTDSDGSYSTHDIVDTAGSFTYQASFEGDGSHDPANASDTVSVTKLASHVSLDVSARAVTFGSIVHLTAHLGRGTRSRVVAIYAKPDGGNKKLIKQGKVDRHRDLRATFVPSKDTTFTAR